MNARTLQTLAILVVLSFPTIALSQPSYSIDFQSPGSIFVGSGTILAPVGAGQFPNPAVIIAPNPAGLGTFNANVEPELDALSFGTDLMLTTNPATLVTWQFSVDEFAIGLTTVPGPSVTSEGANGATEAAADIYASNTAPGPIAPGPLGINTGVWDGNGGLTPFNAPGLNLREPHVPNYGVPDNGDNLDAWEANTAPQFPAYYSLDSAFADVLETATAPPNAGSAAANSFVGGDILVTTSAGVGPSLYASAGSLGLDSIGTPDSDDLDALVLWENGTPGYQPTIAPYSWLTGTDMVLFSVRRGSSIIGMPDALFSQPITEGDILIPILTNNGTMFPGIFVPAELLGLSTFRVNPGVVSDELDALDLLAVPEPGTATLLLIAAVSLTVRTRRRAVRKYQKSQAISSAETLV